MAIPTPLNGQITDSAEGRSPSFTPGFDAKEAETLIAIDAKLNGPTPPVPVPPIPANWQLEFDSPVLGITDQKWQLWKNTAVDGQYAISIRGTVGTAGSIIEDLASLMISAKGSFTVGGLRLPYTLAEEPDAAVHLGFTLGLCILLFDGEGGILAQLFKRRGQVRDVFISGHSQGASIATLLRSYFEYSELTRPLDLRFKTYIFAQAKPGNDHYAYDFETIAGNQGLAFNLSNSQDWIPQLPFSLEFPHDLNVPNLLSVLEDKVEGFFEKILAFPKRILRGLLGWLRSFFGDVASSLERHGRLPDKHVRREMGKLKPVLQHLASVLEEQDHMSMEKAEDGREDVEIVHTLNFVGAGPAIALRGTPGTNPDNPSDFFWQHHAGQYYQLLLKTFPES